MRSPSAISCTMRVGASRGGRRGSGARIITRVTADTTNDTASTRIANGALAICTSAPAKPGPPISAIDELVASLLLPSTRRSRPKRVGTYAGDDGTQLGHGLTDPELAEILVLPQGSR